MNAHVLSSPLRFAGYAALFHQPDGAQDIILPGAFLGSLAERTGPLPLFWQHRPEMCIGSVERVCEDNRGLQVIARIDNPRGRAASLLRSHTATGLSFGYRARAFRHQKQHRLLEMIDIFEISLVTHPLQPAARVHLVA
ncbi:MAG: HK97 family phage prohead protease [Sphingomonadaceae bacterium]